MNQFELFCMIYYVLDAEWDESKDEQLGDFLSRANPFLFADIGSADPSVYAQFCEKAVGSITIENSYHIAAAYIKSLENDKISSAFSSIGEEEWIECVKEYLVQDHKVSRM